MATASDTTLVVEVKGMHCAGCAQRATAAARRVDGVVAASADAGTGRVQVAYDPATTDPAVLAERLGERLAAAGFPTIEQGARS